MNGSTHELLTKKVIEILDSLEPGITLSSYRLKDWVDSIAKTNSSTDHLTDLEFVDVEGSKNTGRDNPHKSESDAIDDKPHYKENFAGLNMDLTAMNHFIDIRKGAGNFDDYDGYSYQSAKNGQHEKQNVVTKLTSYYVDDLVNYWYNDEYVHAPGQEYYRNCSPSVWRYSFPKGKGKYTDRFAELKARFPLAEYAGKSGKGIPYSTFMPVDNLGRYWFEHFLVSRGIQSMGYALHAVQDAAVPLHASGYLGNFHRKYEDQLDAYAKTYLASATFRKNATDLYNRWKNNYQTVASLRYETDYNKVPGINWRTDFLITWLAFRAYREFLVTYSRFAKYSSLNKTSAAMLFDHAGAMSMLLLEKAKKEHDKLYPSNRNRVKSITVTVVTRNSADAGTDSDIALHIYSHGLEGGAMEMTFKDIPNVDELERGRTDSYTVDVSNRSIDAGTMKLGLALLGQDKWLPEKITITYVTADGINHTYTSNQTVNAWLTPERHYLDIRRGTYRKVVSGIRVAYGSSASAAKKEFSADYIVVDKDLNSKSGGKYIYLGYKMGDEDKVGPITNLTLTYASKAQSWKSKSFTVNGITATYNRIDIDLNKGSGGKYIYLCYTTDRKFKPLTGIDVVFGGSTIASYWEILTWEGNGTNADVNKGSGGKYIYILQRRN